MATRVLPVYPAPRLDRATAGVGGASGAGGAVPLPRLWPFEVQASSLKAGVIVSTAFRGPAIIEDVAYYVSTAGATGDLLIDFLVSTDASGARVDALDTSKPLGTSLLDPALYSDASVANPAPGSTLTFMQSVEKNTHRVLTIGRAVSDASFFLKVYLRSVVGANSTIYGTFRVREGIPEDQLTNFL